MTAKTEQQKRFEAAWHTKWPNDEPRIFEQDTSNYTWPEVQDTFEGFALGEASALERAAKVCDAMQDALAGWRYIRAAHGDLYGVGWDRVEEKLHQAIEQARGTV